MKKPALKDSEMYRKWLNRFAPAGCMLLFAASVILGRPGFCEDRAGSGTPSAFTITDSLGRDVEFTVPPERIVLAGRGLLMVADALYLFLGAAERVVAIERITQGAAAGAAVSPKKRGAGGFLQAIDPFLSDKKILPVDVGVEHIAAVHPDAVLLKSYMRGKLGVKLEGLGIPVVYLDFETTEQYYRDVHVIGSLLQEPFRAGEIVTYYQRRVERVRSAAADVSRKPSVLLVYYSERGGEISFNVPPGHWLQTRLVELAGGVPVWKNAGTGKGWSKVGLEQIAAWNPDIILVTAYFNNIDDVTEKLRSAPEWQSLTPVRAGRLYGFPSDFFSWDQPDPRWILGLLWLAETLHPELRVQIDLQKEFFGFYREMYGLEEDFVRSVIQPVLSGGINFQLRVND